MIFGYLDDAIEEEIIRRLVRYNEGIVLCCTWLFGGLVVLKMNNEADIELHNILIKMYTDKGRGMKYYFKGEELL
jgi:hypothetical protein